jgi:hypothetical protein
MSLLFGQRSAQRENVVSFLVDLAVRMVLLHKTLGASFLK